MRALTNGGPRRLGALCAVAAVGSLLLAGGPAAHAVPDPDGTYVVPAEPITWADDEAVTSSEIGGIDTGGFTFDWSSPGSVQPTPRWPDCADIPSTVSGPFVVGRTTCGGGGLYRIDVRTSVRSTRADADGTPTTAPVGATDDAWILEGPSGITTAPFDTAAPAVTLTLPAGTTPVDGYATGGPAGIVYVVEVDGSTPKYALLHTAPDLTSHTVLADLGSSLPSTTHGLSVRMSGVSAAWLRRDTSQLGYVELGGTPVTVDVPQAIWKPEMAVVQGAVSLVAGWQLYVWIPGQPLSTTPLPVDQPVSRVYPAATTTNEPAFAVNTVDSDYLVTDGWILVDPAQRQIVYRDPGHSGRSIAVAHLQGSPGRVVAQFKVRRVLAELGDITGPHLYSIDDAYARLDDVLASMTLAVATGSRLAALDPGLPDSQLRLTDVTGAYAWRPLRGYRFDIAASGPWTAVASTVAPSEPGVAGIVVMPDGRTAATLPTRIRRVEQDGRRTLYEASDGSVWLRDVSRPVSSINPRRVTTTCPTTRRDCRDFMAISGRRIVVSSTRTVGTSVLRVYDTVSLAMVGSLTLPSDAYQDGFDYALDGDLLLLGYTDGTVYSVDLGTLPWVLVPRATRLHGPMGSTSTHLVWSVDTLDGSTFAGAPIGADWGDTGRPRLLGSWSPYGDLVSTGGPAWRPTPTFSGPLDTWTFTIRSSTGAVVRTWTSTESVPLGQINDVSWNARRATGSALPPGRYTWTVTGTGPNGSPAGLLGTGPAGGTVTVVVQHASSTRMTAAPVVDHRTRIGATLAATADGAPIAGEPLTLWKRIAGTTTWTQVATARTTSNGTATWSISVWQNVSYQVRHPSTPRWGASASSARWLSPA